MKSIKSLAQLVSSAAASPISDDQTPQRRPSDVTPTPKMLRADSKMLKRFHNTSRKIGSAVVLRKA